MNNSLIYTQDQFSFDIKKLSSLISKAGMQYDSLIAITRGGLVPTGYLSQSLNIKKTYTCGGYFEKENEFQFINYPQPISGKILLISDLVKTGKTLAMIINAYRDLADTDVEIDIACIHYFSEISKEIIPKYYIHKYTEDGFITYPWESAS